LQEGTSNLPPDHYFTTPRATFSRAFAEFARGDLIALDEKGVTFKWNILWGGG
jgi:hypothetical protein